MKLNRFLAWALALLLALAPVCANTEALDEIWAGASGGADLQQWLDTELASGAGGAADNYVLCLIRSGKSLDYSAYIDAASAKLEAGISNVNTRMRTVLALMACGGAERVPGGIVDECAGKLGAMSWVWALHLLNNGASSQQFTVESVVEQLISMQLEDGGWRVTGDAGDVDATCMCLQALGCVQERSEALNGAIERALDFLAARQRDSGGFASMGEENAESAAQVLIALCGLDIAEDDTRFVKGGRTVADALMDYRAPSGGFAHLLGGEANPTATAQALQALIAREHPGEGFYDFSNVQLAQAAAKPAASELPTWKRVAFIIVGAFALLGVVFSLTRRRAKLKWLLSVLIVAALAAAGIWFVRIDSAADYYDPEALAKLPADGYVTVSIRCDSVAGRADDGSTPADGAILPETRVPIAEGDSAFDALTSAARANSIRLEYDGTEATAYVRGINSLYEFDYGELSGWLYYVNGVQSPVSCGSYALSDGDELVWRYSTDMGGEAK